MVLDESELGVIWLQGRPRWKAHAEDMAGNCSRKSNQLLQDNEKWAINIGSCINVRAGSRKYNEPLQI